MSQYGKLWAKDTFRLWSRRWEYPFVAQRLIEFAEKQGDGPVRILDAGSGSSPISPTPAGARRRSLPPSTVTKDGQKPFRQE